MENKKTVVTNRQTKFLCKSQALIKGCFKPHEAKEILVNLFNNKINYHNVSAFGINIRTGEESHKDKHRAKELENSLAYLNKIIEQARRNSMQLAINCDVKIKLKPTKIKKDKLNTKSILKTRFNSLVQIFIYILTIHFVIAPHTIYGQISADSALKRLKDGNIRFVNQKSIHPNQDITRLKQVEGGQKPFATIVGCSDSRVPSEIIFDQGLGDLFIVRTAGQVSSYASWGSIEFANAVLGSKLIVVMGHTKCGAVSAACKLPDVPGHIVTLINAIKPAAEIAKQMKGDTIENAVKVNVAMQVKQLQSLEPVLTKAVKSGNLKIVGAVYNLSIGIVEFLPENYLELIKK